MEILRLPLDLVFLTTGQLKLLTCGPGKITTGISQVTPYVTRIDDSGNDTENPAFV